VVRGDGSGGVTVAVYGTNRPRVVSQAPSERLDRLPPKQPTACPTSNNDALGSNKAARGTAN